VYHQGIVWPWLLGAFVEGWVRVRGGTREAQRDARSRFVAPLIDRMLATSGGHLCEITDAAAPFAARGCPFQAWSLGELLRLEHGVLQVATNPERSADSARVGGALRA
jgi:glycogen debranching enzyme